MLLNGARGLSEPQASCPECRFAFKHFFSPLEVSGFWNGARNIPLHSQKGYPSRPLRFLRTSHRKLSEAKQAEKTAKRRGLKVSPFVKSSGRAFVTVAILLLSSHMNRAENRTLLQVPFCGDGGCGRGDFEGKLAQLGVPCADVRPGGEIV